jgi:hypothetical protein
MSEPTHKSQSQMRTQTSDAYRENYDRMHGAEHKPTRGKWVWDTERNELVPAHEYRAPQPESDVHTQISMDRHYENTGATDGTDIGSRRKRNEYMRRHGLADASDYRETWQQAEKKRGEFRSGTPDPRTREAVGRALYEQERRKRTK